MYVLLYMVLCMRTTLRLNDALMAKAKRRAAAEGITLTALVEDALRRRLADRPRAADEEPLPTFDGGGTRPGVDVLDNSALLAYLDEG
jgi:hypothetical protein